MTAKGTYQPVKCGPLPATDQTRCNTGDPYAAEHVFTTLIGPNIRNKKHPGHSAVTLFARFFGFW
jgi:hypothetical protein